MNNLVNRSIWSHPLQITVQRGESNDMSIHEIAGIPLFFDCVFWDSVFRGGNNE